MLSREDAGGEYHLFPESPGSPQSGGLRDEGGGRRQMLQAVAAWLGFGVQLERILVLGCHGSRGQCCTVTQSQG